LFDLQEPRTVPVRATYGSAPLKLLESNWFLPMEGVI